MKSPKNFLIVSLFAILLCVSTVYIAFINPTSLSNSVKEASKEKWDVKITNVSVIDIGGTTVFEQPVFSDNSIQLESKFTSVGDYITYYITIKNDGTMDAKLVDSSVYLLNDQNAQVYLSATKPVDVLRAGEETFVTVKLNCINQTQPGVNIVNSVRGVFSYRQN